MIVNSVTSTPTDYLALQRQVTRVTNNPADNTAAINAQIAQDAQAELDEQTADAVDMERMRATLDQRIDQDLASGTLSSSDAAAVRLTLDVIDAQTIDTQAADESTQTSAASTAQTDSTDEVQPGTNTAASESAARTVLNETVTVAGSVKTTVITYSDGTSETMTTVATPEDILQYGSTAEQEAAQATAMRYLATIEAGTLFTQLV